VRLAGRNQTDLALSMNSYPMAWLPDHRHFINAFNHMHWTNVNADCSDVVDPTATCATNTTVGQITGVRNPREVR
jgi:hypothetical protein